MDIVSTFLVNTPTGLWTNIINAFQSFLGNFALAIILLTICIKVVFLPLDFLNRKTARDNARAQAKIAPEMEKLQKQYASDPNMLNQKRMELYKKNGMMGGGSCAIMLIYMVLTIVVFCTLFTGILSSNQYRQEQIYLELRQTYTTTMAETGDNVEQAQQAVLKAYDNRNSKFLWIQNVWLPDNPWTQTVVDFDGYLARVGDNVRTEIDGESKSYSKDMTTEQQQEFRQQYNETMAIVIEKRSCVNGYLITTILAAGTAFLSQTLMQRRSKMSAGAQGVPGSNKILRIILPALMGVITLFYNAIFGLYIIAMQLFGMATMPLFDKILDKMYEKKQLEEDKKIIMDYSRK